MSRAQLTSTVEQNTGGAVSPYVAGKNKIINGDFGIWQRGTSFTPAAAIGVYTTDRWNVSRDGSGATVTISQQTFTPGAAPVAGYEGTFFYRQAQSVAGSGGTYNQVQQRIENVQTFAGQTVTLSFWARVASGTLSISNYFEQNFGSGGSSSVFTNASTANTITTSWQRFTQTISYPSISGKTIGTSSYFTVGFGIPTNTTFTLDIWGVQLEAGSVATPFTTATGTLSGELAACRRYLPAFAGPSGAYIGYAYASNAAIYTIPFDVPARVAPTGITVAGTINALALNTQYSVTPTFDSAGATEGCLGVSSGLTITAGQGSRLNLSTSALILFTGCEL